LELFLQKPNLMTLTIGMAFFRFQYTNDLSAILVGAMFNAIPMLILFSSLANTTWKARAIVGWRGSKLKIENAALFNFQ
jgi:ABC-type glycerol-3-phosphate transport system permease component